MDENTTEKLINFFMKVSDGVLIVDKNLKPMLTDDKLYKNNSDKIDKDRICYLDEIKNCIIQLDFGRGLACIDYF